MTAGDGPGAAPAGEGCPFIESKDVFIYIL
jgi:hypothetical protein